MNKLNTGEKGLVFIYNIVGYMTLTYTIPDIIGKSPNYHNELISMLIAMYCRFCVFEIIQSNKNMRDN